MQEKEGMVLVFSDREIQDMIKEMAEQPVGDMLQALIDVLTLGNASRIKGVLESLKKAHSICDEIMIKKFMYIVSGIAVSQADRVRLSSKLFEGEKGLDNAFRLIDDVQKLQTKEAMNYYISAFRSFSLNLIDQDELFRILYVISNTLTEDLDYLKSIATEKEEINWDVRVQSLSRNGLTVIAGIDGNEDPENQKYIVSRFGMKLDRYVLSLDDENRQQKYKSYARDEKSFDVDLPLPSDEEMENMVEEAFDAAFKRTH